MQKKKAARLAGFVGALCASGMLVGYAVTGTGAYFSDSHSGEIDAGTGQINVTISPSDGKLHFDNLLPGDYQTQTVNYAAHPKGGTEDIWMVFPNFDTAGDAFASEPSAGPTPLGRYGHFALASSGGASFTSYNLALSPNGGTNAPDSCSIDGNGWGGSNVQASDASDTSVPYCAPAHAILLQSNMAAGDTGHVNLTFGFTPILTGPQNAPDNKVESYEIVATQHGVNPLDNNN